MAGLLCLQASVQSSLIATIFQNSQHIVETENFKYFTLQIKLSRAEKMVCDGIRLWEFAFQTNLGEFSIYLCTFVKVGTLTRTGFEPTTSGLMCWQN